jgi:hypothetical protein
MGEEQNCKSALCLGISVGIGTTATRKDHFLCRETLTKQMDENRNSRKDHFPCSETLTKQMDENRNFNSLDMSIGIGTATRKEDQKYGPPRPSQRQVNGPPVLLNLFPLTPGGLDSSALHSPAVSRPFDVNNAEDSRANKPVIGLRKYPIFHHDEARTVEEEASFYQEEARCSFIGVLF